jgi:hypothetical protein
MEAANRGAWEAGGKTIGLNIRLPFEQRPNPYITPALNFEFHYFFMRKLWFAYLAKALVVFPGGFGTLDEMFEILTLAQTHKLAKKITVVIYGSEYWKKVFNFDWLVDTGAISPGDSISSTSPIHRNRPAEAGAFEPEARRQQVATEIIPSINPEELLGPRGSRALTLAHILPALAFVLVVPFYFFGSSRVATVAERILFPLGTVVGITAYAMSVFSVGGWTERSAVLFFNTVFLLSLWRAFQYMRRGDGVQQRRWMLRAIVILLGIATTRPVMGVFFATAPLTHLVPSQFFGIAFWVGFSINALVVEFWLRSTSHKTMRIQARI